MDPVKRRELEDVTRDGLVKLGATPEQLAHVLEPGISDEELARRANAAVDACIASRLGGAGMRPEEVASVMDTSGTPEEQARRREAAAAASFARSMQEPGAMDALVGRLLDDPRMRAQMEAMAAAEVARRRRRGIVLGAAAAVAVLAAAFVAFRPLRPSPCAKVLGTNADLTAAFGVPARLGKIYDTKYFCDVAVEDPASGHRLAWIEIEGASRWSGFDREVTTSAFASVEPASVGDASKLGIAGPPKKVATDMGSLLARRRAGSHDPIGDVLGEMGPAGHTLVARAGKGALHVVFYGSPEQARAVTTWLSTRIDPVRSVGYR